MMKRTNTIKLNIFVVTFFFALILVAFSYAAFAESVPSASGQINSSDGAVLRKSASSDSAKKSVLKDNTVIIIHKEVFKSKTSTSKKISGIMLQPTERKGISDLIW